MEKDSLAVERLKLLSNTAMLKKVLDKKDPPKLREFGTTGETRRDSCAEDPAPPMELSSDSIRSPRTSRIENSHRAETPSSHPTGDTTRDSPPVSRDAAGITPIMSHHQQYLRTTDGEHFRSSGGASTLPLVPTMSRRDYTAGVQGESYYPQRNNTLTGMAVVAHGLYPGPGRPNRPYSVKENVPPCAFQNPYGERRLAETPHYRSMNEGSVLFYPPQVASVSEDREDASPMISYEGLTRANYHMHDKLKEKDAIISSLQQRVNYLEKQISELRQLPTGKISHIPIEYVTASPDFTRVF